MAEETKLGFMGYIKPLFCDNGSGMSIGRMSLWLTLTPALRLWWTGEDIQINHLYALGFLFLYEGYKKIPMFIKLIKAWKGTDKEDE